MTDITTFPALTDGIIHNSGPTWTFIAEGAILAGQVVAMQSDGTANTVQASKKISAETVVGVAIVGAANGERVTIALTGSIVTVANADDTTACNPGNLVIVNDNSVGGTVSPATKATTQAVDAGDGWVVGQAITAVSANGNGKIILNPFYVPS